MERHDLYSSNEEVMLIEDPLTIWHPEHQFKRSHSPMIPQNPQWRSTSRSNSFCLGANRSFKVPHITTN